MHLLITGAAGFIGSQLTERLLDEGHTVTGLDNFNSYYDPAIKEANVARALEHPRYTLVRGDIRDAAGLEALPGGFQAIIHLAARAGVRPSLADPTLYQEVNVLGTQNLLELARHRAIPRFIFGSSSSVYGVNPRVPWREDDAVLEPISPYAATKVTGELMGHVYSHLYGIRFIGLRFFTVYGPRQRPDLAIHKFARLMRAGEPIPVYGDGSSRRDYTYIDDILSGITAALHFNGDPRHLIVNLGNDNTVSLAEMIAALESALDVQAVIDRQPDQPGDVPRTWASLDRARSLLDYRPTTTFEAGLERFAAWLDEHP